MKVRFGETPKPTRETRALPGNPAAIAVANDAGRWQAIAMQEQFGVGAGASRLVSGTQSPHVALERAIAKWKNVPAAIAFNSGYAAAVGTLPSVAGKTTSSFSINSLMLRLSMVHA